MIQAETRNVVPTEGFNPDWLEKRSADYEGDDEQIGNAEIVDNEDNLWPDHSDEMDDFTEDESLLRHPVAVWEED